MFSRRIGSIWALILVVVLSTFSLSGCVNKEQPTGVKIPEGFKINCYPKSECTRADSTPLGDNKFSYVVILKSKDDRFKIQTFYKTEIAMSGYKLLNDASQGTEILMNAVNDQYRLDISILTVADQSIVSLSWRPR
ncbi:MAG TPA: hypothetical protein PL112_25655 [Candidatus Obscuribacter sp.]|nr:hypothetical protein [Candidatus Obscuribacter sp.]HMX46500.1 hypothetical protein [Candidatus Obscuribacter sp.]HNA74996.1 hypothetical protein [Candidatus Obscuribacter sp.]HND70222.1 hypothetical protein [Candidatus Obscuribacter sp.]HNG76866.1 hypothetical protein [Candidatus Obscuribacter sp.]